MTDAPEPDERAERAFRDALTSHAETFEPASLEAPGSRSRRRWLPALVAAAVLALVSGTALAAGVLHDDDDRDGTHLAGKDDLAVGTLPAADAGWRWVSWRNVAVQVPEDWAYGVEPSEAWCVYDGQGGASTPRRPYVALDSTGMVSGDVGCIGESPDHHPAVFGPVDSKYWAPHLAFGLGSDGNRDRGGVTTFREWSLTEKTVGDVQLRLLTNSDTATLTGRILDSATQFETDQNGCDATSPVQAERFVRPSPPFDVDTVDAVDSISVCLYRRSGTEQPGLSSSRLITGADADALLAAIKDAPTGGGPDTPENCLHNMYGDTGLAVRLHTGDGTRDLYAYVDWCFGNGLDDGTNRRELTVDNCRPLFAEDPVRLYSGSSAPFSRCHA
jgi:hypothetical protein